MSRTRMQAFPRTASSRSFRERVLARAATTLVKMRMLQQTLQCLLIDLGQSPLQAKPSLCLYHSWGFIVCVLCLVLNSHSIKLPWSKIEGASMAFPKSTKLKFGAPAPTPLSWSMGSILLSLIC